MNSDPAKSPRGRPKTLDREHILEVAMQAYWAKGINDVSLNEICRIASISKPGLYREFGNEDGLMKEVLIAYQSKVLEPLMQLLITDAPFRETLDKIVQSVVATSAGDEMPSGCLAMKMRYARLHLGDETRKQIDQTQQLMLSAYENWVDGAKARGEFTADLPTDLAAAYIDAQFSNAMAQLARGEQASTVAAILAVAFSIL